MRRQRDMACWQSVGKVFLPDADSRAPSAAAAAMWLPCSCSACGRACANVLACTASALACSVYAPILVRYLQMQLSDCSPPIASADL